MPSRILRSGASMLGAVGVALAPTAAGQTVRSLGPGRVIVPTPSTRRRKMGLLVISFSYSSTLGSK